MVQKKPDLSGTVHAQHREETSMKHQYGIVTCHVAVDFQRPQGSTAIRIYPVIIGCLAQVFVGFTGRLVDR